MKVWFWASLSLFGQQSFFLFCIPQRILKWHECEYIFIFAWTILLKVNIMSITRPRFGINHAIIWQPPTGYFSIENMFMYYILSSNQMLFDFFPNSTFSSNLFGVSDKSAWFLWCFLEGNSAPLFSNSRENMRTLINLICNSEERNPWSISNPSEPALRWPQSVISCENPFRNVLLPLLLLQ